MCLERRDRYAELDYFGGAWCLLLIFSCAFGPGITGYDPGTLRHTLIYTVHRFATFTAPAFLFYCALRVSLSGPRESRYIPYALQCGLRIYVPYLIVNLACFFIYRPLGIAQGGAKELLAYILNGTLSEQFYYVLLLLQFLLLMPLWRRMLRHVPWYTALFLSLFLTVLMTRADTLLGHFNKSYAYFDRVFPTYLVFWVAGLYAGKHYDAVRDAMTARRRSVLALAIVPALYLYISWFDAFRQAWIFYLPVLKIFTDLASTAVVLCLCLKLSLSPRRARIKSLLSSVHAASKTAFFSYAFFVALVTELLRRFEVTDTSLLILSRAGIAFTAPFLLWQILSGLKTLSRRLSTPRNPSRETQTV